MTEIIDDIENSERFFEVEQEMMTNFINEQIKIGECICEKTRNDLQKRIEPNKVYCSFDFSNNKKPTFKNFSSGKKVGPFYSPWGWF